MEQERTYTRNRDEEAGEEEGDGRGGMRSLIRRPRVCQFCADKNKLINYKDVDLLRGLVSDRGKIRPSVSWRWRSSAPGIWPCCPSAA